MPEHQVSRQENLTAAISCERVPSLNVYAHRFADGTNQGDSCVCGKVTKPSDRVVPMVSLPPRIETR